MLQDNFEPVTYNLTSLTPSENQRTHTRTEEQKILKWSLNLNTSVFNWI